MSKNFLIAGVVALAVGLIPVVLPVHWVSAADARLQAREAEPEQQKAPVAQEANEAYCTGDLKRILRRVLTSCGLIGAGGGRGCQPLEAKNVATMDDADFNALFVPMQDRGGIIQYEKASAELDERDKKMIDDVFVKRGGASYFLVVSRASPEGSTKINRDLSKARAEAVMAHLKERFNDPELEKQVGLLWLGEEYAQLDPTFCDWTRSGAAAACQPEELNRSAFIAWIDCRL